MRIVVCPDTHIPEHDRRAFDLFIRAARASKPDVLVLTGDFLDAWSISRHEKSASRHVSLLSEFKLADIELKRLDTLGIKRKIWLEGNHCERLRRYINTQAQALDGLVSIPQYFNLQSRGWEWIPYRKHIKIGKCYFAHDVGPCGKNVTLQTLDAFQHPIVIGHSHRAGIAYAGNVAGGRAVAMSCGWLGDKRKISYVHQSQTKDWQLGFGIVDQDPSGVSWCQFVPIVNYRCMIDGKLVK